MNDNGDDCHGLPHITEASTLAKDLFQPCVRPLCHIRDLWKALAQHGDLGMRVNSVIIPAQLSSLVSGHQSYGNTLNLPPTGSCHVLGLPVTASACGGLGLVATENIPAAEGAFSKKQVLVVVDITTVRSATKADWQSSLQISV
jgi:hypothetical protein